MLNSGVGIFERNSSAVWGKQMKDLGIWKSDGQTCGHVFCTEGRLNLA